MDRLCLRHEYSLVLRLLNRLARLGEIEKWPASAESRTAHWRRLGDLP